MECTKCFTDQPIDNYYVKKDGRRYCWCKGCMSKNSSGRHAKMKQKAIDYMGTSCILCGYDACNSALVFHHLDPNEKDFGIASGQQRSWTKIKPELDKCVMLCQNCHAEVHAGIKSV